VSDVFFKEEVQRMFSDARIAIAGGQYVVRVGRDGRYLGELADTTKDAWESAHAAMPKGVAGDGAEQMGMFV
jgi:hypothetical protein